MRGFRVFGLKKRDAEHITQTVCNNCAALLRRDRRIIKRRERVQTRFPRINVNSRTSSRSITQRVPILYGPHHLSGCCRSDCSAGQNIWIRSPAKKEQPLSIRGQLPYGRQPLPWDFFLFAREPPTIPNSRVSGNTRMARSMSESAIELKEDPPIPKWPIQKSSCRICPFQIIEESCPTVFRLLRAQRLHGIDFGGARGRQPHGEQRHCSEDQWRRYEHGADPKA